VLNPLRQELTTVILRLIQSNDSLDVPFLEYITVVVRGKTGSLSMLTAVNRAHERGKLSWDNPVYISVLYPLVVFILFDIECFEVVPLVADALLETLEAVKDSALVVAIALGGIAEGNKLIVVRAERVVSFLGGELQDNDHKCTHQECRISEFVFLVRAIMEDPVVLVLIILHIRIQNNASPYL